MNLTLIFIAFTIVSITVFDLWIMAKKGKYESISAHIIRASHKYPLIPFLFGLFAGHLFFSMNTADWSLPVLK
jgi:hypothetical protein